MKIFLKALEKLRKPEHSEQECKYDKGWNEAINKVEELIATYVPADMWIPTDVMLPEEPDEDIDIEETPQYTVTIKGAEEATSLHYVGDGRWMDTGVGGEIYYPVSAWMPMPKVYKENLDE